MDQLKLRDAQGIDVFVGPVVDGRWQGLVEITLGTPFEEEEPPCAILERSNVALLIAHLQKMHGVMR